MTFLKKKLCSFCCISTEWPVPREWTFA